MMRKVFLLGIILAVMIVLVGCQGKKHFAPAPQPPTPDPTPTPAQFKILEHSITVEWSEYLSEWRSEVIGKVRNDSSKTCTPIIRARFYDTSGVMVGSSTDGLWD